MQGAEKSHTNIVLCWHMHQPWYRESQDGDYQLPWVYLHALKDYVDMAAHLESHPDIHCVVNFTPVLLEQLDDYAKQFREHLADGKRFSDPLLNLLAGIDPIPSSASEREEIIAVCRRAHAPLMIDVHAPFRALFDLVMSLDGKQVDQTRLLYMNDQFFLDLLSWYHLTWLGHSLKQLPHVQRLIERGNHFTHEIRRDLVQVMCDAFDGLIGRYARLARDGQVELSMTPYGHPIVPLLIDIESMHDAMPEAKGPKASSYPGGLERARWHIREGLRVFEHFLGCRPTGVWLSEGAVSEDSLRLLDEFGFAWSASGEGVWNNSRYLSKLPANGEEARRSLFCSHRVSDCNTRMFFRDDGLSDMIGFEYQQWNPVDAATNFSKHLDNIADYLGDECHEHVVSVILDGENAWEYYQDNAFHFLGALYEQLSANPRVRTLTFTDALEVCPPQDLPSLCPGSWVYGSFSTWIGDPDKNLAWDLLIEAKKVYDRVTRAGTITGEHLARLERQLAICEGSDWFWWFGDYNPTDSVNDFDRLYRQQLVNLYKMLDQPPPDDLKHPVSHGGGAAENAGTMRRGHV
jgi:alpha-amylase/alpha-mannosidase (GH57 family)